MKKLGIFAASVVAVVVGGRLVLATFSPVLPPDFERRYEAGLEATYWFAISFTDLHARYFALHGRWPQELEDLWDLPEFAAWRERSPDGFRSWVEDLRAGIELLDGSRGARTIRYTIPEGLYVNEPMSDDGSPRVRCDVTLDVGLARAIASADARGYWVDHLPDDMALWSHMDCRRLTGPRTWLAWAGLDRYRRPPPARYAQVDYAHRALDGAGFQRPP